jgi:hypothetical protein
MLDPQRNGRGPPMDDFWKDLIVVAFLLFLAVLCRKPRVI